MGKELRFERAEWIAARSVKRRVLVAFEDVGQRTDVAACLMLAGHDVVLARSLDQRAGLIGAVCPAAAGPARPAPAPRG